MVSFQLSCPEIAIHKFHRYGKPSRKSLSKANKKDYSMSLHLQIVNRIETGSSLSLYQQTSMEFNVEKQL